MATYFVNIQEILERSIPIEANNADEAMNIAKNLYNKAKIILDATDHIETNFSITLDDFQYGTVIKSNL